MDVDALAFSYDAMYARYKARAPRLDRLHPAKPQQIVVYRYEGAVESQVQRVAKGGVVQPFVKANITAVGMLPELGRAFPTVFPNGVYVLLDDDVGRPKSRKPIYFVFPELKTKGAKRIVAGDHFTFYKNFDVTEPLDKRLHFHLTTYDMVVDGKGVTNQHDNNLPLEFQLPLDPAAFRWRNDVFESSFGPPALALMTRPFLGPLQTRGGSGENSDSDRRYTRRAPSTASTASRSLSTTRPASAQPRSPASRSRGATASQIRVPEFDALWRTKPLASMTVVCVWVPEERAYCVTVTTRATVPGRRSAPGLDFMAGDATDEAGLRTRIAMGLGPNTFDSTDPTYDSE